MEAFFTSSGGILMIIFGMVALSLYLQKYKGFKSLGPVLTIVVFGILLSNLRIVPTTHEVYNTFSTYCVPLSVSICLMSMNLTELKKLSRQPLIALISAIASVCFAAFILGLFFAPRIDEGWKVAGMFVGTYTGGTPNLTAIATGLDATRATIASANAADYVVSTPLMVFLFAAPALLAKSKLFKKLWPYHFTPDELKGSGDQRELMADKEWSIRDIAWLLALGFTVVWLCTTASGFLFSEGFRKAGRLLLITTASIGLAQVPAVQKLRGNLDLGLFISLTFLSTIGFSVNLKEFFGTTFYITIYCFLVLLLCIAIHLIVSRLFKVKYEYVLLSMVGCIVDGPTASLVAAGSNWKSLINVGLLMGVLAGASGNYVGIMVAYAVKNILHLT